MKNLIERIRLMLVIKLIGNKEQRGLEKFFQNSAAFWIEKYKAFAEDGTELQKYAAKEIDKYRKERNKYQAKFFELEEKYNALKRSAK